MNVLKKFTKGAEFWLGRYYHNKHICIPSFELGEKFGEFIVSQFTKNEIKEELCSLISESFVENFESFSKTDPNFISDNCFEEGNIHYDKKFKYIRLPNFKSKMIKNFELRISINPCLSSKNNMTKIYCNSLIYDVMDELSSIDFQKRSNILCNTVNIFITKLYSEYLNTFFIDIVNDNSYINSNDYFFSHFDLKSTFIGSDDKDTISFIKGISDQIRINKFSTDVKLYLKLINNVNESIGCNFKPNDYLWRISSSSKKSGPNKGHSTNAIIGYAENDTLGHLIGISDNVPRNILLPLHVKFITDN